MTSGATLLEAVYQPLRDILEQKACGGAIGAMSSSSGSSTNGSAYHQHLLPAGAGGALISPPNSSDLSDTQQMPSYLLSNMEASGNANNQRANFTSSLDSRDVSSAAGSASTAAAASLVMQRAASTSALYPRPGPVAGAALSAQYARSNSLSNAPPLATLPVRPKSSATQPPNGSEPEPPSGGAATTAAPSAADESAEVVIEERRKRVLSDGSTDGSSYTIHRYVRGRLLGKGGFAKVYLCTAVDTNKHYAVKVVPKANLVKARARQKLQAEIKIHRMLKHKHVCEFKHFFEDRENCYILLELCHNQSMNEMIKRRKRLTEPEAAYFMSQLLLAVQYMHENNVIHRDLKLGNLFIDKQLHIKVGDLGLATRVEDKDEKRKTICGTPNYIAPEIIQSDKSKRGHSFEVDVWSMGVILYTLLIGKPPYEAKNVKATYQRILKNEYSFPPHVSISSHAKSLIVNLLQSDPSHRPSLAQIAAHPFLTSNFIPTALPSNAMHFAPQWSVASDRLELIKKGDACTSNTTSHNGADAVGQTQKPGIPRPSSRQPFGYRDINSNKLSTATNLISATAAQKPSIDMERVMRTAVAISGVASDSSSSTAVTKGRISASAGSSTSSTPSGGDSNAGVGTGFSKFKAIYSCGFKIFEEAATPKTPHSHSMRSLDEAALVQRTKALAISSSSGEAKRDGQVASRSGQQQLASYTSFASSSSGSVVLDGEILQSMVNRLDAVLDITGSRKGMYRLQVPRSVPSVHGPRRWVVRYVDYTSKYGLGFLLNDGSSGVYFNDSTKTVLDAGGEVFQYMERKPFEEATERHHQGSPTTVIETHTLSSYPDVLKKKVTLLKHFRNYLLEQYKEDGDGLLPPDGKTGGGTTPTSLVYVKKWVRTRHAILFRLSDQTIQVVFFDQSELLLTPDDRYITYVDKSRKRLTYHFTDDLIGASSELETRLKYTKEILSSLIQRR